MDQLEKQALQAAKEITVKFIEAGRISPSNFTSIFSDVYLGILKTISGRDAGRSELAEVHSSLDGDNS